METLEARRFLAATIVQGQSAELSDPDGSKIAIDLQGSGMAVADMINGRLALIVTGTTTSSNLTITVTGGNGRAITRSIQIPKVGNILAPHLDLAGSIAISSANLLQARFVSYAHLDIGWLGRLVVNRIRNATIDADRIVQINVTTDVTDTRIRVAPANDTRPAISAFFIRSMLDQSTIFTLGDIGTLSAAAMYNSNIVAGVRISELSTQQKLQLPLPARRNDDDLYDFIGIYRIGQVVASGKTANPIAFSNTIIGAFHIEEALLYNVDGNDLDRPEFGVAAYTFGRVKRTFDSANVAKNLTESPAADFQVRQIATPASFTPIKSGGSIYNSSGTFNIGAMGGSGTLSFQDSLTSGGWLRVDDGFRSGSGVVIGGSPSPFSGAVIGSISNHPASQLYVAPDGQFQLRDNSGGVFLAAATLSALAVELFRQSNTSVKVEGSSSTSVTLRTTSVSPAMSIMGSMLGASWSKSGSGTITISGGTLAINQITVPTLGVLQQGIQTDGIATEYFSQPLVLIDNLPLQAGTIIDAMETTDVNLTPDLRFVAGGSSGTSLDQLLNLVTSHPVGSRRRGAKWVASTSKTVLIYGLPDGSTAKFELLDQTALNASGELRSLPNPSALRQALIESGLSFQP